MKVSGEAIVSIGRMQEGPWLAAPSPKSLLLLTVGPRGPDVEFMWPRRNRTELN